MANDPQVPWTDEQWARVNQVIQEEAKRARVAATFLPLYGPLDADADFVRKQEISYSLQGTIGLPNAPCRAEAHFGSTGAELWRAGASLGRSAYRSTTGTRSASLRLQVIVAVRNAQMADPEAGERAGVVSPRRKRHRSSRGRSCVQRTYVEPAFGRTGAAGEGSPVCLDIWQITGAVEARGIWSQGPARRIDIDRPELRMREEGSGLSARYREPSAELEQRGQFGPFAVVLGQQLFLIAQTPDSKSLVLPQDRIIPFLGGRPAATFLNA